MICVKWKKQCRGTQLEGHNTWETLSVLLATTGCGLHLGPSHLGLPRGSLWGGSLTACSHALIPGEGSSWPGVEAMANRQARASVRLPQQQAPLPGQQRNLPRCPRALAPLPVCQHLQSSGEKYYHIRDRNKSKDKIIVCTQVHQ